MILERYKTIKNIPMLRNLVLKLLIFLQNHILINLVLKLSNNYIRSNIAIKQVNMRFILILKRYKIIKSISDEEKSGPQIIEFSPISQYVTLFGNLVLKLSNFRPYHNISHYCESEYNIHSYFIHRILKFIQLLLVSTST